MINYKGRFAPSPSGLLHFGSLIAATASYLEAHVNKGEWIIRIEDLDKPREVAGASDNILQTLQAYGFEWNDKIVYQSKRLDVYQSAFDILKNHNQIYPCACSRKEIADSAICHGIEGLIYPGTCRNDMSKRSIFKLSNHLAYRVKVAQTTIEFRDCIQGLITQNLATDIGDFVLKRADGLFAYQLAVVVDDSMQGITHVVRGADLLDSTPRQIYLLQLLGLPIPRYAHLPIASNYQGEKLSKQNRAQALERSNGNKQLWRALTFLGQFPPNELQFESLETVWRWAKKNWVLQKVPKQRAIGVYEQDED